MTQHVVMTRAAYGSEWSLEANRRRLEMTKGVTARMMARQTTKDWSWVVLLNAADPLRNERLAVFEAAGVQTRAILWTPPELPEAAPWDKRASSTTAAQRVAASAYKADWRAGLPADQRLLMTRLDDDDALAPDALARVQATAAAHRKRTVLMLPEGIRVWAGQYSKVRHETNAMHTLLTPPGDGMTVYDYGHRLVARVAPVVMVDDKPGWLWARHRDTISGWKKADQPVTPAIRRLFPVDWSLL